MSARNREQRWYRVTRTETYLVTFVVRTTSQLKARQEPTPTTDARRLFGWTVGNAELIRPSTAKDAIANSQPGDEYGDNR